jgi:prepilin-type processing-associated H-X9-DG protein
MSQARYRSEAAILNPLVRSRSAGFARTELLVLIAILLGIISVLTISSIKAKQQQRREQLKTQCVNNLRNIGLAYRIWSTDCGDAFPFEVSTNDGGAKEYITTWQQFQTLSNELSIPRVLICPGTTNIESANWQLISDRNITYFIGVTAAETSPQAFLSGDEGFLISGKEPDANPVILKTNTHMTYPPSVHRTTGNIAFGDGSVLQLSPARLTEGLRNSGLETNILLVPR